MQKWTRGKVNCNFSSNLYHSMIEMGGTLDISLDLNNTIHTTNLKPWVDMRYLVG